jgi:hypothetical protein
MASPIFEVGDIVTPKKNFPSVNLIAGSHYTVIENNIPTARGYQCRLQGIGMTPHEDNLILVQKGNSLILNQPPIAGQIVSAPAYVPGDLVEALSDFPLVTSKGKIYTVKKFDGNTGGIPGIITFVDDSGVENCIYETHFKMFHQNSTSRVAAMGVGGSGLAPAAVVVNKPKKAQPARRLSSLGEKVKSEFEALYAKQGCTCDPVVGPQKCSHCIHPGNPKNIEFYSEYWEDAPPRSKADAIWDALQGIAGKGNT